MAIRQTLTFKKDYYKYDFIQEMDKLWNTFADEEVDINSQNVSFYQASKPIIDIMEIGLKKHFTYNFRDNPQSIKSANVEKDIICCISGGKDSLATALYYIDKGYNVSLYTLKGINKGYPEEYHAAINLAKELNLPLYIDEIKMRGKKFFMEHPLKNQIIASCAIAYCLDNNLTPHISFGNYNAYTYDKLKFGFTWTDCHDVWNAYNNFISTLVNNAQVYTPFYIEDDAYTILDNHFELTPLIQSCMITIRNREQLRKHNQEKYGVSILPNRCGSCTKCCLEYIHFADNGKFEYNQGFYKHCLDILKKKYQEYLAKDYTPKDLYQVYKDYFPNGKSKYFDN